MATTRDVRQGLQDFGLVRDRLTKAIARAAGLPVSDLSALECVEHAGRLTQRELTVLLSLTPGSVSVLVDRLENAGLCRRVPHDTDRRATWIELAPRAEQLKAELGLAQYEAAIESAARSLDAAARDAVCSFLALASAAATEHLATFDD